MKFKALLLVGSLCLLPMVALAVRVPGLYEVEVPVQGQQESSRQQAIELGMKAILVKLTGDRNASVRSELLPLIREAVQYVQQYHYVDAAVQASGEVEPESNLKLRISFDEVNLNDALRKSGVRVWGRERPSILVWLAMEKDQIRTILTPEQNPDYFSFLNQQSSARGIILMHPLFDLEDSSTLQASDIRGGFQDTIMNASQRYSPDTVLSGWIESPLPGIWEARWTLSTGGQTETWSTEGSFAETILTEGLDNVVDRIATQFVQQTDTTTTSMSMRILDITTVKQYASVVDYLQSLSPVSQVEVVAANPGNLEFRLTAHGGEQAVLQAINFGRILEPVDVNKKLYRLLP